MKISEYLFRQRSLLLFFLFSFFSCFAAADSNFIFVDLATNLCLDSDGNSVYTHVCNGGVFQVWTLQNDGVLHNTASSNQTKPCLDSNSSGNVYPNSCNGGDFQKWLVKGSTLVNKATGLALDSNSGGSVYTMSPNGGSFQNWTSKQPGASSGCSDFYVNSNGSCVYAGYSKCPTNGHWDSSVRGTGGCACNTGYYWDSNSSQCAATQAVFGSTSSSSSSANNSGVTGVDYFFVNTSYTADKWCLDNDGTNVYALQCNQGAYQKWTMTSDGVLYNKQTNRCINDNGSGYVNAKSCDGTNNQKWLANDKYLINKVSLRYLSVDGYRNISTQPFGTQSQYQVWFGKDTSQDSGCSDFYVKSNGSCVSAGYSKCPTNGHWDSAVRGTGGCACNTGYLWDGSQCAATQAVISTTTPPLVSKDTQTQSGQVNDSPTLYDSKIYESTFYGVKIYRGDSYSDQLSVGPYGTDFQDGAAKEGYFDGAQFESSAISSIKISKGYQVELFANSDFTGTIISYRGNNTGVPKFAKSMRIWQQKADSVTVYQDSNFSGATQKFAIGDFPQLVSYNMENKISSLSIPAGWIVVLYEQQNFQGKSKVFTASNTAPLNTNVGNDFNDVARSMRIIENQTAGNWGDFSKTCQYYQNGQSYVQYDARLWGLGDPESSASSYGPACEKKGAWIEGRWMQNPASCVIPNNDPALTTVLSVAGFFIPFLPEVKIVQFADASKIKSLSATLASQASAAVTIAKDTTKLYDGGWYISGVYGRFLVRDETQCNVLYHNYSSKCLSHTGGDSVNFTSCDQSSSYKEGRNQFLRDGETFATYEDDNFGNPQKSLCLNADNNNLVTVKVCNGSNNQNWEILDTTRKDENGVYHADGGAQYRNKATQMCLDGDGFNVYTAGCNDGNAFQEFF